MLQVASYVYHIQAPVHQVFAYLADLENFADWFPGVKSVNAVGEKAFLGIGKEYIEQVSVPLLGTKEVRIQVTQFKKNSLLVTEGDLQPLLPRMCIKVEQQQEQTRVEWSMYSRNGKRVFQLSFLPVIQKIMQSRAELAEQRLLEVFSSPGALISGGR